MRIFAIDTSSKYLCLGIYDKGRVYEYTLETKHKLSSLIMPSIQRILEVLNLRARDFDYFACGLGPGSFTGIRVGLSTVKGFAWAAQRPVVGISTLDTIALNASDYKCYIMPVIDAKRNMVYTSIYKMQGKALKKLSPYRLLRYNEFLKIAKNNSVFLGDGIEVLREKISSSVKDATMLDKDQGYPKANKIIALAHEKIQKKQINNSFDIRPIYLYPKECQIKSVIRKS